MNVGYAEFGFDGECSIIPLLMMKPSLCVFIYAVKVVFYVIKDGFMHVCLGCPFAIETVPFQSGYLCLFLLLFLIRFLRLLF